VLDAEEDAGQQHRQGAVPGLARGVQQGSGGAEDPGVVEQAVQPAELRDGDVHQACDVVLRADVHAEGADRLAQLGGQRGGALLLQVGDDAGGAFADGPAHDALADPARASGDHRDLAPQPIAHVDLRPARRTASWQNDGPARGVRRPVTPLTWSVRPAILTAPATEDRCPSRR
jgi:hypothetical protein